MKNNPAPSTGKPTTSRVGCQVGFSPPLHLSQSIRYLTIDIIWAPDQVIRVSTSRIGARGWVHGLRPQDLCAEALRSSAIPQFASNRTFT